MKIRFTADALHETEGRGRGRQFKAGKVYDLPDDQAKRWLRRNAAEEVAEGGDDEVEEVKAPAKAPEAKPPAVPAEPRAAPKPDAKGEAKDAPGKHEPAKR